MGVLGLLACHTILSQKWPSRRRGPASSLLFKLLGKQGKGNYKELAATNGAKATPEMIRKTLQNGTKSNDGVGAWLYIHTIII